MRTCTRCHVTCSNVKSDGYCAACWVALADAAADYSRGHLSLDAYMALISPNEDRAIDRAVWSHMEANEIAAHDHV